MHSENYLPKVGEIPGTGAHCPMREETLNDFGLDRKKYNYIHIVTSKTGFGRQGGHLLYVAHRFSVQYNRCTPAFQVILIVSFNGRLRQVYCKSV